jgi:hypothetical protein
VDSGVVNFTAEPVVTQDVESTRRQRHRSRQSPERVGSSRQFDDAWSGVFGPKVFADIFGVMRDAEATQSEEFWSQSVLQDESGADRGLLHIVSEMGIGLAVPCTLTTFGKIRILPSRPLLRNTPGSGHMLDLLRYHRYSGRRPRLDWLVSYESSA